MELVAAGHRYRRDLRLRRGRGGLVAHRHRLCDRPGRTGGPRAGVQPRTARTLILHAGTGLRQGAASRFTEAAPFAVRPAPALPGAPELTGSIGSTGPVGSQLARSE